MRGPRDLARVLAWRPVDTANVETALVGESPRAQVILQNRPQTPPNLQLSTNTIFSSL